MYKIMMLTDSGAHPRSFPASMLVDPEETYPFLLRYHYLKNFNLYRVSFGNITTEQLLGQGISYFTHWKPDIIVVQSGLADCRPEPLTDFQMMLLEKMTGRLFTRIKNYLYRPEILKHWQAYRVSKKSFRRTVQKFKAIFSDSKILWLEICSAPGYESMRPGVNKRIDEYNEIIKEVYGDNVIRIQKNILEVDGFNLDHIHWKRIAHRVVADVLIERIDAMIGAKVQTVGN